MDKVANRATIPPLEKKESNIDLNLVFIEVKPIAGDEFLCLVCKRKFPNSDKLRLHEEMSTLHKVSLILTFRKICRN